MHWIISVSVHPVLHPAWSCAGHCTAALCGWAGSHSSTLSPVALQFTLLFLRPNLVVFGSWLVLSIASGSHAQVSSKIHPTHDPLMLPLPCIPSLTPQGYPSPQPLQHPVCTLPLTNQVEQLPEWRTHNAQEKSWCPGTQDLLTYNGVFCFVLFFQVCLPDCIRAKASASSNASFINAWGSLIFKKKKLFKNDLCDISSQACIAFTSCLICSLWKTRNRNFGEWTNHKSRLTKA